MLGDLVALVDGQLLLVQRLFDRCGGVLVDLHHLAHGALTQANGVRQFFAGINRRKVRQCCRTFLGWVVCLPSGRHIGLGLGFDLRLEFQGDLAQLPLVQVAAALLGIQRPLLGLQQIVKGEYKHLIGQAVLVAQGFSVMPVNDDQIFIDDDGGIAPIFQEVRLQCAELLLAQRREQPGQLRQHDGRALRAAVNDPGVLH